jgi:membrane protease YdiL (CAAX protease family)
LHHVRRSLWPFTVWAVFQGLLFGTALHATGVLCVPMVAHFLHDLAGFGIFHYLNRKPKG